MRSWIACVSVVCTGLAAAAPGDDARAKHKAAAAEHGNGNYQKAIELLDEGLALAPKDLDLLGLKGTVLLELRNYAGALAVYEAYLKAGATGASQRDARKIVGKLRAVKTTFLEITVANGPGDVYLDSKAQGLFCRASPSCNQAVVPDQYKVIVERPGYKRWTSEVTVESGKTTKVAATLNEESSLLTVNVTPSGARVTVDGAPHDGPASIAPGTHQVVVSLAGHSEQRHQIEAREGKAIQLAVALAPIRAPPERAPPERAPPERTPPERAPPEHTAEERRKFDAAFEAMKRGEFASAAPGFRAVASSTGDAALRSAAGELGRLADDLVRRGGRLTFGAAPRSPDMRVVAVSADDEPGGGRANFVGATTLAAAYGGVVLIDVANVDDARSGTLIMMGSTAAGLLGSLFGTRGGTMTGGMADGWTLGLLAGASNALLLSGPLGLYDDPSGDVDNSEKVQSLVLASSWGFATAGFLAARGLRPTRAQVNMMAMFGVMGGATALASAHIAQPDSDVGVGITAAGLNVSLAVGAGVASKLDWSLSRVRYVGASALLGALVGVGTSVVLFAESEGDEGRPQTAISLATLWGGFALGTYLTRNMAPDYRFRRPAGTTAQVAPTAIRDAPGLAVVGTF